MRSLARMPLLLRRWIFFRLRSFLGGLISPGSFSNANFLSRCSVNILHLLSLRSDGVLDRLRLTTAKVLADSGTSVLLKRIVNCCTNSIASGVIRWKHRVRQPGRETPRCPERRENRSMSKASALNKSLSGESRP